VNTPDPRWSPLGDARIQRLLLEAAVARRTAGLHYVSTVALLLVVCFRGSGVVVMVLLVVVLLLSVSVTVYVTVSVAVSTTNYWLLCWCCRRCGSCLRPCVVGEEANGVLKE
jgi:hypothetical protein